VLSVKQSNLLTTTVVTSPRQMENYGSYWQYDHVIPCASFDFTQEDHIKECFHWSNIRPLNKNENNSKNDIVCEELIERHQKTVDAFIKEYGVPSV
jgi:hypothetical protein